MLSIKFYLSVHIYCINMQILYPNLHFIAADNVAPVNSSKSRP